MLDGLGGRVAGGGMSELRMSRAIALLRLGEQENCLTHHNPLSCVFPIQPAGVHTLQRGSRGAMEVLAEQLRLAPDDLAARWLFNIAAMTVGEWPDKVPTPWLIPPRAFESEHDIRRFPDVAGALGLDLDDLAGGCILDDFDNDGWLDVCIGNETSAAQDPDRCELYHNNRDGTFSEVARESGLEIARFVKGVTSGDYDNDGWLDFYLATGDPDLSTLIPNRMFRNAGGKRFQEVTSSGGFGNLQKGHAVGFADLDQDGDQEIGLGNATGIQRVELYWPTSGLRQTVKALELDRAYRIREGELDATELQLPRVSFNTNAAPMHAHRRDGKP